MAHLKKLVTDVNNVWSKVRALSHPCRWPNRNGRGFKLWKKNFRQGNNSRNQSDKLYKLLYLKHDLLKIDLLRYPAKTKAFCAQKVVATTKVPPK